MTTRLMWVSLAVLGLTGLVATVRVAAWPLAPVDSGVWMGAVAPNDPRPSPAPKANGTVAAVVSRDFFRVGRLPAITAYDPIRLSQPVVVPPPRPVLTLLGIVSGPDPSAVIQGLPGVEEPRVMRVGDAVAGLVIKQIGPDRVVIAGRDTTWVLTVREPWKN